MNIYKDINTEYGKYGEDFLVQGHDSIVQAMTSMLRCQATSRFMRPYLESPLWLHLSRPMTEDNAYLLMMAIFDLISTWEPRITLNSDKSRIVADISSRTYNILLSYEIEGSGRQGSLTFSLQGV